MGGAPNTPLHHSWVYIYADHVEILQHDFIEVVVQPLAYSLFQAVAGWIRMLNIQAASFSPCLCIVRVGSQYRIFIARFRLSQSNPQRIRHRR